MKFKKSNKLFAHIDCDSFFAECEILRNPNLKNKYVLVWKEIVLACNYKTKALWIKTWTPVWQAKEILKSGAIFLDSDHDYYSIVSSRLMTYLEENLISVEPFSIDEAFCEITWLAELNNLSLYKYIKKLQQDIKKYIWIPVSIWVSNTRIKSKIFSEINKPNGIFIEIDTNNDLYKSLSLSKVPFIWKASVQKLKFKCDNIYDFLSLGFWYIKNNLWKTYCDLWLELNWVNSYVVKKNKISKSISRWRSFNKNITNNKDFLYKQLIINFNYLFEEFIVKEYETKKVILFYRYLDKKTYFFEKKLSYHTSDRRILLEIVKQLFYFSYNSSNLYRSTWLIFSDLKNNSFHQIQLFENYKNENNMNNWLYTLVNSINKKYNSHKICFWMDLIWKWFSSKLWIRK